MASKSTNSGWWKWMKKNWHKLLLLFILFSLLRQDRFGLQIQFMGPSGPPDGPAYEIPVVEPPRTGLSREEQLAETQANRNLLDLSAWSLLEEKSGTVGAEKTTWTLPEERVRAFVKRFGRVAQNEQKRFGVPASIVLASSLLHSGGGLSESVHAANNYFMLPCTADWQGASVQLEGQCLRKYSTAWMSFRDHTLFLSSGRFAGLSKELSPYDYQSWARALARRDYPGAPDLGRRLIQLIEQYELNDWDQG